MSLIVIGVNAYFEREKLTYPPPNTRSLSLTYRLNRTAAWPVRLSGISKQTESAELPLERFLFTHFLRNRLCRPATGQAATGIFPNQPNGSRSGSGSFFTRRMKMSRFFSLAVLVAAASIVSWGCTSSEVPSTATTSTESTHDHEGHDHEGHDHAAHGKICGSCGESKGTADCCSETAAKCDDCGMNKGSHLCCVELDESAAGKDLCGLCGQVAGSDSCCAEGAEKCECGMAKGSPLCCKLKGEQE